MNEAENHSGTLLKHTRYIAILKGTKELKYLNISIFSYNNQVQAMSIIIDEYWWISKDTGIQNIQLNQECRHHYKPVQRGSNPIINTIWKYYSHKSSSSDECGQTCDMIFTYIATIPTWLLWSETTRGNWWISNKMNIKRHRWRGKNKKSSIEVTGNGRIHQNLMVNWI